jgi:hypothetical protein
MLARLLRGLLTLALLAGATPLAYAQGGGATTSLSGTVTDTSGAVIPGANVNVKNAATSTEFTASTNEQGVFTVPAIDPGTYTVTVTLMGFKTAVLSGVRVNAAVPATVRATLDVGGLEETVSVTAGSEIVQTTSPAVSATIDTNQIMKLPTTSRNALDFITSLPGVNTPAGSRDSTINGLPQSAINITIDGVSAQDNWLKTTDGFFARVSPRLDAMEEVTVNMAAQDAASTGQGAVQIRFATRSGTNEFRGSSYYYLRHHKLNANDWFNNRDLAPDPATGKAPKDLDKTFQPGTRVGGPIVIPGLWNGRGKAFFFFNYEEQRTPGQNTENRTVLHPLAEQGVFRYTAGGQTRPVNLLQLAADNGHLSTIDPTVGRLLRDIRTAVTGAGTGLVDLSDPLLQQFTYQYQSEGLQKFPTGRVDVNITNKHRASWSLNYTDLLSTPDTTNNREPNFPGFPGTGNQHSDRYTVQGTLRSTLGANLVNEFRVGRSGGATLFSPEIARSQFEGTSVADQGGFLLDINGDFLGITNAHSTGSYSAREAGTKIAENTLNWIKGSHSLQMGMGFTQADVWIQNQQHVPTITFGIDANDAAAGMFNTTNFPGASTAQLNDARELYATLVGRLIGINGELRLNEETDEYEYLGLGMQRAQLRDWGFFLADTWRWKPNLTLNVGLRYELQQPFRALNNSYSFATLEDVCGPSGVAPGGGCNVFQHGVMTGRRGVFQQFNKGVSAYKTDRNNFAPSLGFAWTLGGNGGLFGSVLGREEGDSVVRGGYTLAYERPGMADFATAIDDNPGISQTANRNHSLGNLGSPGGILLRNRADLGPPSFPTTRVYPMTDVVTGDIMTFDPNLQTPYSQTWTAGWQRKLTRNLAVEARYVGTRSLHSWVTYNYNETNIVENGFLDEFRLAQQNLQAHVAAGCGRAGGPTCTFAYRGAGTGTSPLPTMLALFNGLNNSRAGDPSAYGGTNWTSAAFQAFLAARNPNPFGMVTNGDNTGLINNATRRQNMLNAGLPANFFVANPDYLGGAELVGNGGYTKYNSLQLELRKRLSHGFQFHSSYVFGQAHTSERYSLRTPRRSVPQSGTVGGVTHAFKTNWTMELPFGQGRRFASGAGAWLDRLVGGWSLDGIARIQSGRLLDFGNVRLIGMSAEEFSDAFRLRFDDAGRAVYMLPEDIIENTVRAWSVNATSPTGYSDRGVPIGRYLAPANSPECIETAQTSQTNGFGRCGVNNLVVTGPRLVRFDMGLSKRVRVAGRVNFEFRAELLNAFNHPWFEPVTWDNTNDVPVPENPDLYRVTDLAGGSREVQLIWRVNW